MAATAVATPRVKTSGPQLSGILDYLSTVDHKKIGIMYLYATFTFFLIGGILALLVRLQLASPANTFLTPTVYNQVMKPSTAQQVGQMMTQVVKEGTGTAAALSGITVAGKTGTAQVGTMGSNLTQPWFIAYAPVENPRVAIAVTVERTQGGFGGTVAAPIAKSVIETLLAEGK